MAPPGWVFSKTKRVFNRLNCASYAIVGFSPWLVKQIGADPETLGDDSSLPNINKTSSFFCRLSKVLLVLLGLSPTSSNPLSALQSFFSLPANFCFKP